MDSLVFFGSLRSKKLLKIVIESDLNHLEFFDAKIFGSKLYKVKDENFPFLQRTDSSNDFIDCTYIKGLTKDNPIDAEFFWQEMLEKAKEEVNK